MLLSIFPDDHFPGFSIGDVGSFVGGCRQERVMLERGEQAQCGARVGGLEQRVDQVVDACCIQAGKNECAAGAIPDDCTFIATAVKRGFICTNFIDKACRYTLITV
jgi:hypothetical protein